MKFNIKETIERNISNGSNAIESMNKNNYRMLAIISVDSDNRLHTISFIPPDMLRELYKQCYDTIEVQSAEMKLHPKKD